MDGLAYTNPCINLEEASSPGQKRKAGEDDRGCEPDHAEESEAKQSRVGDIATRRAELLQMLENLSDRTGKLNVCIMCGKESHDGTCTDMTRATESDLAREKIQRLFLPQGHPSSDEDIDMEDGRHGRRR